MRLLCPNCREPLDSSASACPNGHEYAYRDGVLRLLADAFADCLTAYTSRLSAIRADEGKWLMDVSAYEGLPFSQLDGGNAAWRVEWRLRAYDLAIVSGLLGSRSPLRPFGSPFGSAQGKAQGTLRSGQGSGQGRRILDVGAWNGWLSHRLAALGHDVTAIDYFADEYDGLAARKYYSTHWLAIQMNLTDLSVLDERFDVVILNRCLAFFTDPAAYQMSARQLLAPGGMLILTGLQFFGDARVKARSVEAQRQSYLDRYGFEVFLHPTKGYLDFDDRRRLQAQRVMLKAYPQLWLANLKSLLRRTLPSHMYGVCFAESGA